jgi:hypothetical protein
MAPNSPGPFFVQINYQSEFAPHSMEIPTLNASEAVLDPTSWNFLFPGGDTVDVSDAVADFVDLIKTQFPASVSFTNFVLFSKPDPDLPATPVFSGELAAVGTNGTPGWYKAAQLTMTFRTNEFGIWKLVLLDVGTSNNWDKVTVLTSGEAFDTIRDFVTSNDSWIIGRDGGRPQTFLQIAKTLNEKLRRSYRMN